MEIIFIQARVWGKWGRSYAPVSTIYTTLTLKQKREFILELNMNDHDWGTQI